MSSFPSDFKEKDALFLKFDDKFNNMGESSSVGDNSGESRRCQQSQNLELERYVYKHGKILITIAPRAEKPISSYAVRSNHGRTRLLYKSSLTIIIVGPSHFYNDSMRSLKNEVSQLTMQSYSEKRMLGVVDLFRGPVVDAHVSLCEKDVRAAHITNGRNEEDDWRNESDTEEIVSTWGVDLM
ncbi:NBS-LRR type resistance protein [Cucumis melo var. makuwa]|uniref:NBS-LRR type resistance protein n=1 Tax=Cucumis melo var. makuwa TaxID=1194695 RepID=A0A5A7SV75_CUCMM|nr:NBS-LRR type resistance protein [Cucumis melo var. makuwa]